jgi:hypothetical protein
MAKATARHILVASEAKCNELKAQSAAGAEFADVAKTTSTCPARWSRNSTPWSSAHRSMSCKVRSRPNSVITCWK